jgi:DNA-binding MarR family transcriptional regulator
MSSLKTFGIDDGKGKYYEEATYSLALIYNVITNEMTSYLDQFKLTPGKFNILMVIKHQGKNEGIPQVEISKKLIVTPSNMTKLIDKLEKDGLVERSALEGDRRVNIMKITSKGSKLLDQVWPEYNERLKGLISGLNQNQQKDVSDLLKVWLVKLQGV